MQFDESLSDLLFVHRYSESVESSLASDSILSSRLATPPLELSNYMQIDDHAEPFAFTGKLQLSINNGVIAVSDNGVKIPFQRSVLIADNALYVDGRRLSVSAFDVDRDDVETRSYSSEDTYLSGSPRSEPDGHIVYPVLSMPPLCDSLLPEPPKLVEVKKETEQPSVEKPTPLTVKLPVKRAKRTPKPKKPALAPIAVEKPNAPVAEVQAEIIIAPSPPQHIEDAPIPESLDSMGAVPEACVPQELKVPEACAPQETPVPEVCAPRAEPVPEVCIPKETPAAAVSKTMTPPPKEDAQPSKIFHSVLPGVSFKQYTRPIPSHFKLTSMTQKTGTKRATFNYESWVSFCNNVLSIDNARAPDTSVTRGGVIKGPVAFSIRDGVISVGQSKRFACKDTPQPEPASEAACEPPKKRKYTRKAK